jgi:hypothetical protein
MLKCLVPRAQRGDRRLNHQCKGMIPSLAFGVLSSSLHTNKSN